MWQWQVQPFSQSKHVEYLALPKETFKSDSLSFLKAVTSGNVLESSVSILGQPDFSHQLGNGTIKGATTLQQLNFDAFSLPFPVWSKNSKKVHAEMFHDVRHQATA